MKIINKISVKKVVGKFEVPKDGEEAKIMQIMGIATGIENGKSDFGDWIKLLGSFQAVNLITGEIFRSGEAFAPGIVMNMIAPQLNEPGKSVSFGFTIGVRGDATSAVKYTYTCMPLMAAAEDDPLEQLVKRINAPLLEHKSEEKFKKTKAA